MRRVFLTLSMTVLLAAALPGQQFVPAAGADPLHRAFDQILDANVRDGMVYYRALAASRGPLDRYITSLNVPAATYEKWSAPQQMAFWVDAYNAFVLETVVSHYPLHGTIRSIPGAFDKATWHAAGRTVTLDQIERTILPEFKEPRLYLALGRGCLGSGRLRSEAYTAERLDKQLADIPTEFVNNAQMYRLDRLTNTLWVTPILSWREADFVAAYDTKEPLFADRSPLERAVVAFVATQLLASEKEFIQKNQWKMAFLDMDWKLNDLSGR